MLYILLRVLNVFLQLLTHQLDLSIRIRKLEDLNNLAPHIHDAQAAVGNGGYVTQSLSTPWQRQQTEDFFCLTSTGVTESNYTSLIIFSAY